MHLHLTILAKSDKHIGFCVAGINSKRKIMRLVRDKEGHALYKEQCKFKKLDSLIVRVNYAPLKHQRENYILDEIIELSKPSISIKELKYYLQKPDFIFLNTKPWLIEEEMSKQKCTFLLVKVDNLNIYKNDEEKYKADFTYNGQTYKGFSITDPKFKLKSRKISKAIILVSLPNATYNKYGKKLYYKFICAVYPYEKSGKSYMFDCYKI